MDFDIERNTVFSLINQAKEASAFLLDKTLRDPDIFVSACVFLLRILVEAAKASPDVFPKGPGNIRVCIAEADEGYTSSLRLRHCAGYGEDADQRILLPITRSLAGEVMRTGGFKLETQPGKYMNGPEDRIVKRLMRKDIKWIFCTPIFAPNGNFRFVACMDGNTEIEDSVRSREFFSEIDAASQKMLSNLLVADR
ncbi:MAG: hypothetical protein CGW95_14660 [Phenylobacterium zucineum]|nr:MAG: hypothetical protein CGW95_14660 [Phenylobacterium zucineum]